ncbi:MAG: 3-hydroxybutyryl-CoA dehydrogenase, partial [Gemmatimonadota bacterium]|nr:3-hydroxybutyryl-CoA dehydrogenase [Gemmatimonadota bacterium]
MTLESDTTVGVVGAGTMGAGIAQLAAVNGHAVILSDAIPAQLDRARAGIAKALARQVEKGKLTQADADAALARITCVAGIADAQWARFAPCGLVIEAILEDLALKKAVLGALERVVQPDAILASNTSSLSIAALGAACKRPERVIGIHFFNPAPVMPLVEIIGALSSDPAVVESARAFVAGWGKTPVVASDTPGFIVNRVARP